MPPEQENPIAGIDYEESSRRLTVTFSTGETLQYDEVSPQEATALFQAKSFGEYIDAALKHHPRRQID